ncbi:polysaccharide biosynthesis/export family protein [Cerasicoccus frondis]|uniref:polysaccharide biosynthesis/export family protein n=1 Tax=Cerasicoccus frondis TaxID=490090 RepID=UPI0028528A0D|nr:polysaccharide biosynthesis/export family protein [Cerasicoccus frondis]
MKSTPQQSRTLIWVIALAALLLMAGCASGGSGASGSNPKLAAPKSAAALRPGDTLQVNLQGIPDPSSNDVQIDDEGIVSLPFIGRLPAAGLTPSELATNIRQQYIAKQIYRSVDVSVYVTDRYIYVGGEVQSPGRVVWTPDLTLTKAVQSAGGFSLYAREGAVKLTRENDIYVIDADLARDNPREDPKLFPGDSIMIERSPF